MILQLLRPATDTTGSGISASRSKAATPTPIPISQSSSVADLHPANAGVLFPRFATDKDGESDPYGQLEVLVGSVSEGNLPTMYRALLTYTLLKGDEVQERIAIRGPTSTTVVSALQGLVELTAAALERYQDVLLWQMNRPVAVAAGWIDESLIGN